MRNDIRRFLAVLLLFVLSMNSSVCTAAGQGSLFMHSTPDKPGAADTVVQGRVPGRIAMISGQKTEEEKGRDKIGTSQVKDTEKEPSEAQESQAAEDSSGEGEKSEEERTGKSAEEETGASEEKTSEASEETTEDKIDREIHIIDTPDEGSPDSPFDPPEKSTSSEESTTQTAPAEDRAAPRKTAPLKAAGPNHEITMPDKTSHYFLLQMNSQKVSSASGSNLKVVKNSSEASRYICEEYPDGSRYNFTPEFSGDTSCRNGGGSGGEVSFSEVLSGGRGRFGDVYLAVNAGTGVGCAYNLNKCKSDPYVIYTNVGRWYDERERKSYSVDMKLSVTGCVFPGEETRKDLSNQNVDAPYVVFTNNQIGLLGMATDSIDMRMDFYYAGTDKKISNLAGYVQCGDVDCQQGIDFGEGFEKAFLFDTGDSQLQYNPQGLCTGSIGYISSRMNVALDETDGRTTAMALFSGPTVSCTFTYAKTDHSDTGGKAAYRVDGGYGLPADTPDSQNVCYSKSNSTGLLMFRADVHLAPIPGGGSKKEYPGDIKKEESVLGKDKMILNRRTDPYVYVLSVSAAGIGDVSEARYTEFGFEDFLEPVLKVTDMKVYRGVDSGEKEDYFYEEVSDLFDLSQEEEEDHTTKISALAKQDALKEESFYGYTYYLHIAVSVRPNEELTGIGHQLTDWFKESGKEEDGIYVGMIRIDNTAQIIVANNMGSSIRKETEKTITGISNRFLVKKIDEDSEKPVPGVVFGLYGGRDVENPDRDKAIMIAETDEEGLAEFRCTDKAEIYRKEFGEGPYCIKEISVPEEYETVWNAAAGSRWSYVIESLKDASCYPEDDPVAVTLNDKQICRNKNRETPKGSIRLYKKSSDTGEALAGAEFALEEWSVKEEDYVRLQILGQGKDEKGALVYTNQEPIVNTMDNLGRYRIVEKKAPKGCILSDRSWEFVISEDMAGDSDWEKIRYLDVKNNKERKGSVTVTNDLQKGRLYVKKLDDRAEPVPDVLFTVSAAEDIYAPWSLDEKGNPLADARPLVSKGTVVDEIRTDQTGTAQTTKGHELYIGSYDIKEKEGGKDHVKSDEVWKAVFRYGTDEHQAYVTCTVNVNNHLMNPAFSVAKLAERTVNEDGTAVNYDQSLGRYTQKKVPGIYEGGETADFTIHVTNTGNVPLYNLVLTDDMDHVDENTPVSLAHYVKEGKAGFILPESGTMKTAKGDTIRIHTDEDSRQILHLSRLKEGDSLEVHFVAELKEDAANAYSLDNIVYGEAEYEFNEKDQDKPERKKVPTEGLVDGEGNSLVKDQDSLHIPGEGDPGILKVADRTSGVTIENGEIRSGSRVPGVYQAGETVEYTIYVKNTGKASLKKITVKDTMSDALKSIIRPGSEGFSFDGKEEAPKELTTKEKAKVSLTKVSPSELLLCSADDQNDVLKSGDYVELTYRLTLKEDIGTCSDVVNEVRTNGWYFNGEEDVPTKPRKDKDKIEVPGIPEARVAKLADRTTGAVLKDGRYEAGTKVNGTYRGKEKVEYRITVTNSGTSNLYRLQLKDQMSERLQKALDMDSVTFEKKDYTSSEGRTVRTRLEDKQTIVLDFLGAGDSVTVLLTGKVKEDMGNLLNLDNRVRLTARYRLGNEEEKKTYEEYSRKQWVTLTYHSNDGQGRTQVDSETPASENTEVTLNGNPFDRPGYLFAGWNEKEDGSGEIFQPDHTYTLGEDNRDLYAMWEPGDDAGEGDCQLLYLSNNPRDQSEADEENSKHSGESMTVNENHFSYVGHIFDQWNTRSDGKGKAYQPGDSYPLKNSRNILYAIWKKAPVCHLVYDANDGSGDRRTDGETPCQPGSGITADGNGFSGKKDGEPLVFAGWNTRPDGSGDSVKPGDKRTIHTDTVLYALWEKPEEDPVDSLLLYYWANNQSAANCIDSETAEKEGDRIGIDENMFRYPGKSFAGWNTRSDGSGTDYKPGDTIPMPSHHVNLYAQWSDSDIVRLIYDSNGGQDERVTDAETPCDQGAVIAVDGNSFAREGYRFTGWNSKKDGSGKDYVPGTSFTLKEDRTLYAQWTRDSRTYRLTYDPGRSLEALSPETDSETPCSGGTVITVNPNRFRIVGLRFAGWNTKKNGKGTSYKEGSNYTMPHKDVTLYAQWEEVDSISDEESGSSSPSGDQDGGSGESGQEKPTSEENDSGETAEITPLKNVSNKEEVAKSYEELHGMTLGEALTFGKGLDPVPETELMKDDDAIHVPGEPRVVVAKLADRTTGPTLQDGRYAGTRKVGTYSAGDRVIYLISVTNRGTSDLVNLLLTDTIAEDLMEVIEKKSISVQTGTFTTEKGNKVKVESGDKRENGRVFDVHLDKLTAGDATDITVTARIKDKVESAQMLNNHVKLTAEYPTGPDDETLPVPETKDMEDDDDINVGVPELVIAKLADRTGGVTFHQGRYSGTKRTGTYKKKEKITFKLTASNPGSSSAKDVVIREEPSRKLLEYADIIGFSNSKGDTIRTRNGDRVRVTSVSGESLTLDHLNAGDQAVLNYVMRVKEKNTTVKFLENVVSISGKNNNKDIPQTGKMRDNDRVNIDGSKDNNSSGNPRTSRAGGGGKTGDDNPIIWCLLMMCIAVIGLSWTAYSGKKRKK